MSDFIRHEFFVRPMMLNDAELESIIVRRGTDTERLIEGFNLSDNEIVGKQDGVVAAFPYIWLSHQTDIPPNETRIVGYAGKVSRSRQWKIDVDSQEEHVKSMTFLTLTKLMPNGEVLFNKFSSLGDKIKHSINTLIEGDNIVIKMTNNHNATIVVNSLITG